MRVNKKLLGQHLYLCDKVYIKITFIQPLSASKPPVNTIHLLLRAGGRGRGQGMEVESLFFLFHLRFHLSLTTLGAFKQQPHQQKYYTIINLCRIHSEGSPQRLEGDCDMRAVAAVGAFVGYVLNCGFKHRAAKQFNLYILYSFHRQHVCQRKI